MSCVTSFHLSLTRHFIPFFRITRFLSVATFHLCCITFVNISYTIHELSSHDANVTFHNTDDITLSACKGR